MFYFIVPVLLVGKFKTSRNLQSAAFLSTQLHNAQAFKYMDFFLFEKNCKMIE